MAQTDYPLILLANPVEDTKAKRNGGGPTFHKPTASAQMSRLSPKFGELTRALDRKERGMHVQTSPSGLNPELALVFEIVGSVDSFYKAIAKIEGFEWIFEQSANEIEADDDFYIEKAGERDEKALSGKVYCLMSNRRALNELLSLWRSFTDDSAFKFAYGYTSLRDVFLQLKDIRLWGIRDRLEETGVLQYWEDDLELAGNSIVPFEAELFYRDDEQKRQNAELAVSLALHEMGGEIVNRCVIESIGYHGLLITLPRNQIEHFVSGNYDNVALAKVDDVMFFRPTTQMLNETIFEDLEVKDESFFEKEPESIQEEPLLALLDGMPMQNHKVLDGRLLVDDPDDYQSLCPAKRRKHGTSMASLIVGGDLNLQGKKQTRRVYVRPIMLPHPIFEDRDIAPEGRLFIDLVHIAVKKIVDEVPSVKIINFSIGDSSRQFINSASPLAKLLDWLSYEYDLLFIVSAGNQSGDIYQLDLPYEDFVSLDSRERTKLLCEKLKSDNRQMKIFSPAESINALTVGALFADGANSAEGEKQILPVETGTISPLSGVGPGIRRAIKPDVVYPGGRKLVTGVDDSGALIWGLGTASEPGTLVAAPPSSGSNVRNYAYTIGTSNATAALTHEAGHCFDTLEDIFYQETGASVPAEYTPLLIKAMLTHGASWDSLTDSVSSGFSEPPNRLSKWLGYGCPDIEKVHECAHNRITTIGFGELGKDQAHIYQLPLPIEFSLSQVYRRLKVTLAYFSPIEANKQLYRSAVLWFSREEGAKKLVPNRQNTDHTSVTRGTLQHEIFDGSGSIPWTDEDTLDIRVSCAEDAGKILSPIRYAIFISFEVAEDLGVNIYQSVRDRLRVPISTPA